LGRLRRGHLRAGTVTHAAHGATAIELPGNTARVVIGLRGGNAVVVDGIDAAAVDTVARAVVR
jgi:hypothetical protein